MVNKSININKANITKVIVRFGNIGGIVDHHLFRMIVRFVNIGGNVDHHLFKVMFALLILVELLTITCLR
jgi:hypothetical protein